MRKCNIGLYACMYIYILKQTKGIPVSISIYTFKKKRKKKVASICVSVYIIYNYNRYTRFVDNRKNILKKEHFNNYNEKDSIKIYIYI